MKNNFFRLDSVYKLSKFFLLFAWILFIFVAISQPLPISEFDKITWIDKIAHFFLFGFFAMLVIFSFYEQKKDNFSGTALLAFFAAFLYALFCENWQKYVPGRYPDFLDLLAGLIGVVFFIYLARFISEQKKPKLLLHVCCAVCGAYVAPVLQKKFRIKLFYYNPCIYPLIEYNKRGEAMKVLADFCGVKWARGEYDYDTWLKKVKGREKDSEGGKRCIICFRDRLEQTAKAAAKEKFSYFATTLTISPHKDFTAVNKIGKEMEEKHEVIFLQENWKKNDGFRKAGVIARGLMLYRQHYCGCEFSIKK